VVRPSGSEGRAAVVGLWGDLGSTGISFRVSGIFQVHETGGQVACVPDLIPVMGSLNSISWFVIISSSTRFRDMYAVVGPSGAEGRAAAHYPEC